MATRIGRCLLFLLRSHSESRGCCRSGCVCVYLSRRENQQPSMELWYECVEWRMQGWSEIITCGVSDLAARYDEDGWNEEHLFSRCQRSCEGRAGGGMWPTATKLRDVRRMDSEALSSATFDRSAVSNGCVVRSVWTRRRMKLTRTVSRRGVSTMMRKILIWTMLRRKIRLQRSRGRRSRCCRRCRRCLTSHGDVLVSGCGWPHCNRDG